MRRALLPAALLAIAEPALAHAPPFGMTGFWGGAMHPVFVPAHLLAIAALGLLIGQQLRHWLLPGLAFAVALALGLGALTLAFAPSFAGHVVLAVAALQGLLVAIARPLPLAPGVGLAGATGLALALDSPPAVVSINEANRMLAGTGVGAIVLIALVAAAARLARGRAQIGARILGAWIAASATLVLALQLAR